MKFKNIIAYLKAPKSGWKMVGTGGKSLILATGNGTAQGKFPLLTAFSLRTGSRVVGSLQPQQVCTLAGLKICRMEMEVTTAAGKCVCVCVCVHAWACACVCVIPERRKKCIWEPQILYINFAWVSGWATKHMREADSKRPVIKTNGTEIGGGMTFRRCPHRIRCYFLHWQCVGFSHPTLPCGTDGSPSYHRWRSAGQQS